MAKKNPKKLIQVAECNEGNPNDPRVRIGSKRYCVTCDALQKGEPVVLQHPWPEMTPEAAIVRVIADNRMGLDDIKNCEAVESQEVIRSGDARGKPSRQNPVGMKCL